MQKSLAIGNIGEQFAVKIFTNAEIEAEKNQVVADRSFYDLLCKIGRKKFSCEVKYDVMAQKTGNIAIEYYNNKSCKDSGIGITKADIWVHVLADDSNLTMWIASVKELKRFIKNNEADRNVIGVGDGNACLYLYKENRLLDNVFHRADLLSDDKLKKLVRKLIK